MSAPLDVELERRRRRFFGRRQSRLRDHQQRRLDEWLPDMRVDLPADGLLDPAHPFGRPLARFWLELGFGNGVHLVEQAAAHPSVGMIGSEHYRNGVAILVGAVVERQIDNVAIFDHDARDLIEHLAPASLERVYVLFPDPWPKPKHHKRRLVNDALVTECARVLQPGGELRLATDWHDYAAWMQDVVGRNSDFTAVDGGVSPEPPPDAQPTHYERRAVEAGRQPLYLRYERSSFCR